jgi:FkbM family methyltransferase
MSLTVQEFIPPVLIRVYNRIFNYKNNKVIRYPPFNYLPPDIDVKWIMDIGANVGDVARSALFSFEQSKVICFEPVSSTYDKLTINLSSFNERVITKKLAISDYTGESEINITTYSPANSLMSQSKYYEHYNPSIKSVDKEKINVVKLDDLIHELPTRHFDIVKIDVEGLEYNVLKGGEKFFGDCVDIIMLEISFQRESGWDNPNYLLIFNYLNSLGFRLINIYDVYNSQFDNNNLMDDMMVTQIDCIFRKK